MHNAVTSVALRNARRFNCMRRDMAEHRLPPFGAEKVYVVDPRHVLRDQWSKLCSEPKLSKLPVSAVKWTFCEKI